MEEYATPGDFEVREDNGGFKHRFEAFLNSSYFTVCVILLVAVAAFCMGKFWSIENNKEPVRIIDNKSQTIDNSNKTIGNSSIKKTQTASVVDSVAPVVSDNTQVVASKNGTKYHLPTCPGAKQISDANRITFPSISAARSAGYTPALNCKGLK